MIDSHCHLASQKFPKDELPELIARARENGVDRMVSLATDLHDLHDNLEIAERFPEVHTCLGIHPCDVHETPDDFRAKIEQHLSHPKVCGIGETGLDYYHPAPDGWTEDDYRERQKDFLRQHFEMAEKSGLNLVIHTRDRSGDSSFCDALDIYKSFNHSVRAVFHCFIFDLTAAQSVINLGGLVSFTGIATFKKPGHVLEVAKGLKKSDFMVETDAPFLSPMPYRGKRNEPSYVHYTAESIALARGETISEIDRNTDLNTEAFFRFS